MTEVTETTRRFMLDSFADVDQLRIFLRLSNERERILATGFLCAVLGLTPDKIERGLKRLKEAGLIEEMFAESGPGFRFSPASPGLADLAEEVLRLDREMPVTLIKLVATRPVEPIKAFADAFKLR